MEVLISSNRLFGPLNEVSASSSPHWQPFKRKFGTKRRHWSQTLSPLSKLAACHGLLSVRSLRGCCNRESLTHYERRTPDAVRVAQ